ncbi:hypothetical protein N658DRAFT_507366 [Parathielavia hyrcaniae]|uniref:Uncharacterized protein n=1 Tax=Parathielavia hyrcaniae TaxID=113614 RepID=A0AAN6PZY6_9PEZI|nr:hypothetical protein N658DRAFT_507366 [Parathielavia hyrcaniae]
MDNHAKERLQTTLTDLPVELIDQILAELKWGAPAPAFDLDGLSFYENLTANTDAIQRVRLTCRRLALRATPLLLPVASLSISDPSSVDRLEHIAAHGAFAPHVKAVHVYFHFYEAGLAADIRELAAHLLYSREKLLQVWPVDTTSALPLPGRKTRAEWNQIFDDWDAFCRSDDPEGADDAHWTPPGPTVGVEKRMESMRILRREHAEYRRRFEAQQRISDSIVMRIANAMARMPRATRLVLDDDPDTPTPPRATASPATAEWLISPTSWATGFGPCQSSPPIHTLFALPVALHGAGIELAGLRIHRLRLPSDFPLWQAPEFREGWSFNLTSSEPDPLSREAEELQAACRSLRVFDFTPDYEPNSWPSDSPTCLEWPNMFCFEALRTGLYEILECILASTTLRQVRVDLQMVKGGIPSEAAMPNPPWPHTQVLHLRDGVLDFARLARFLEATSGTLTQLHLDGMHLTSRPVGPFPGTAVPYSWSAVLDLLRAHCCQENGQGRSNDAGGGDPGALPRALLTVRLRRPLGAEFDDSAVKADSAYIFDPDDQDAERMSHAEKYIHGLTDRNPLVEAGRTPLLYS